jgi:putative FmdB family regulatory protein
VILIFPLFLKEVFCLPVYEYTHEGEGCSVYGNTFEIMQKMNDPPLSACPACGEKVRRLISLIHVSMPTTDSRYKELGFTKLVRRDAGVYENVTAMDGESRFFEADKPETMPDLKRRITD